MPPRFVAYLQLIRLPNVLTAAADSLAGWLLVTGSLVDVSRWLPLLLASMVLYAAGTTLNDVFDIDVDRQERPKRPLPSGRASWTLAAWLGGVGLLLGPSLALASGSLASVIVSSILAACILGYNAGIKHTWLGPILMGACRGLNLLLGMSQAPSLGGPPAWLAAVSYALFVMGITLISRSEAYGGRSKTFIAGLMVEDLAILGMIVNVLLFQPRSPEGESRWFWPLGILVLGIVAMITNRAAIRALRVPTPLLIQKTVKTGILSLVWINVAVVASFQGPLLATVVAAFWFPAFFLGRWLYST
jgi:4-hydroxybenzoate polyprenyltransferase